MRSLKTKTAESLPNVRNVHNPGVHWSHGAAETSQLQVGRQKTPTAEARIVGSTEYESVYDRDRSSLVYRGEGRRKLAAVAPSLTYEMSADEQLRPNQ
jgi:hypothetical protein